MEEQQAGYRRRFSDRFAQSVLPSGFEEPEATAQGWRGAVSFGLTMGLGLMALAALVFLLS